MSGMYDFFWSHALLSDEHHNAILENCNFSSQASVTEKCQESMDEGDADRGTVYFYDIYAPLCGSNSTAPSVKPLISLQDINIYTILFNFHEML